MEIDYFIIT